MKLPLKTRFVMEFLQDRNIFFWGLGDNVMCNEQNNKNERESLLSLQSKVWHILRYSTFGSTDICLSELVFLFLFEP